MDRTCKIWDVGSAQIIHDLQGHIDEIMDINFNASGTKITTASADMKARIYNVTTGNCLHVLDGNDVM